MKLKTTLQLVECLLMRTAKPQGESPTLRKKKLEKAVTVDFKKRTEGVDKVPGSVDARFAGGLPFPVPHILECKAFCDSGNFPAIFE